MDPQLVAVLQAISEIFEEALHGAEENESLQAENVDVVAHLLERPLLGRCPVHVAAVIGPGGERS